MIAKARLISLTLFMAPLATIRCFCVAVTLGWDPSPDAVAGYALHYAVYGDSQTRMVDIGTTTLATIIDLAPGQTYVFYATAYNQDKIESDPSNVIKYT